MCPHFDSDSTAKTKKVLRAIFESVTVSHYHSDALMVRAHPVYNDFLYSETP